ncbi:translation initiation factor 2 [Cellulomonas sp. JH27-2]|uniref:translation initiation factor 2 n=1 Tax=Cellulomonas sp. JH27-2 TaxID=2774139 RepID=UPI00177EE92B|nr:translation initiation factor 2 [Cellulomonas sp. JH27-2]
MSDESTQEKLAEAKRTATQELFKSGTPDYDPRAQQRAVEAERKAQHAADEARDAK